MQPVKGKLTKSKQRVAAKPLADPDARVSGIPDHVKRPDPVSHPTNPVVTTHTLDIKAIKRRLRS